jgi:hypothetical protein
MARINMTVVLDEAHLGQTDTIRLSLEAMGLRVSHVLAEVGVITGTGDEALLGRVRALDGIEEARPENSVQLPPFSDRVPQ